MKNYSTTPITDRNSWLDMRKKLICSSDIATIMGLNPYSSRAELWARKLGILPDSDFMNESILFGNIHEETIAHLWQYVALDNHGKVDARQTQLNLSVKQKIRKCMNPRRLYNLNSKPYFAGTPDRIIIKHESLPGRGVLEIKTTSKFQAEQWDYGIPYTYICQLQWLLMITGYAYGYLAILLDGSELLIVPVMRDEELIKQMVEAADHFWELLESKTEPDPEATFAYQDYLKKRFRDNREIVQGEPEVYDMGVKLLELDGAISRVEQEKLRISNIIKSKLGNYQGFDFGSLGQILWSEIDRELKDGTKQRQFKIKLNVN